MVSYQIAQRNLVLNFLYKKVHVRIGSKLIGGCELLLENLPRADRKQTSSTADSLFFFTCVRVPYAPPIQTLPLIGVRRVRADWSSSNYLAEVNFRIEIKVWAHRTAWVPARTSGRD